MSSGAQHKKRGVIGEIAQRPFSFSLAFFGFFVVSILFLAAVDALPEPLLSDTASAPQTPATVETPEQPVKIVAKSIGLNTTISNPQSTNVEVLDEALLSGAVRYPTSAELGQNGTVLLFGHSSYLPIVHNQAYKAFNAIQNLKTGATISVYSGTHEYRYEVSGVRLADATEDVVELPSAGKHLTLVTCDSFAKKTSRFVVTAEFVGVYSLSN